MRFDPISLFRLYCLIGVSTARAKEPCKVPWDERGDGKVHTMYLWVRW